MYDIVTDCARYGKTLINAYKDFQNAGDIVSEKALVVQSLWSRTSLQIDFVKRVAKTMGSEHCSIHIEVFEMLHSKQIRAIAKIESLMKSPADGGGVKKWQMPFVRASLDESIQALETWQRIFDPTWYLILRIADKVIDEELSAGQEDLEHINDSITSVTSASSETLVSAESLRQVIVLGPGSEAIASLSEKGLDWNKLETVPYSTTQIVPRLKSTKHYILNTIDCESGVDVAQARADTELLARKLSHVDSQASGLLSAHGFVKRKRASSTQLQSLHLVFNPPKDGSQPRSLRQDLMQPQSFSLSRILDLARHLAGAISFVHTCDFVHKNIRPETIVSFGDHSVLERGPVQAYLLGFDSFRNVNFHTLRRGDAAWERDLYRHPSRQGLFAQDKYVMQHDVYSLGVCLLEIGLWDSFIEYGQKGQEASSSELEPRPSGALGLMTEDFKPKTGNATSSYDHVKEHLIVLARSKLPPRLGDKYTSVVITCLTCLDEGNEDFGDDKEMQDEDGVLVGIRFIEKVLLRLNEISF